MSFGSWRTTKKLWYGSDIWIRNQIAPNVVWNFHLEFLSQLANRLSRLRTVHNFHCGHWKASVARIYSFPVFVVATVLSSGRCLRHILTASVPASNSHIVPLSPRHIHERASAAYICNFLIFAHIVYFSIFLLPPDCRSTQPPFHRCVLFRGIHSEFGCCHRGCLHSSSFSAWSLSFYYICEYLNKFSAAENITLNVVSGGVCLCVALA